MGRDGNEPKRDLSVTENPETKRMMSERIVLRWIPNAMKSYQAPWGRSLIVISGLISGLAVAGLVLLPLLNAHGPDVLAIRLAPWLLPAVVLGCLPFIVRGYVLTDDEIQIRRLLWTTRLSRARLTSADLAPKVMNKSLRVCGNGGGFSFTGWYWNKSLGFYRAFVTDLNRTVVLRFGPKTIVVSPGDPDGFVGELLGNRSPA